MKNRESTPCEVVLKKHGKKIERFNVRLAELMLIINDIDNKHSTLLESVKDAPTFSDDEIKDYTKNYIRHLVVIQTFLKRFIRTLDYEYGSVRLFTKSIVDDVDDKTYEKLYRFIESIACYQATVKDMILINKYIFKLYNKDFLFLKNSTVNYSGIKQAYSGISSIHHATLTMV